MLITGVVDEGPSAEEDALGKDAPGAGAGSFVADMAPGSLVRGIKKAGGEDNHANTVFTNSQMLTTYENRVPPSWKVDWFPEAVGCRLLGLRLSELSLARLLDCRLGVGLFYVETVGIKMSPLIHTVYVETDSERQLSLHLSALLVPLLLRACCCARTDTPHSWLKASTSREYDIATARSALIPKTGRHGKIWI